jgi:hypothetical protein
MQWSLQLYLRHTSIHCSNVKINWCSKPTTYICHCGTPLDKVTSNIKFWSLPSKWEIRNKLYTPRYIFTNMNHSLNKVTTPSMLCAEQSLPQLQRRLTSSPENRKTAQDCHTIDQVTVLSHFAKIDVGSCITESNTELCEVKQFQFNSDF